MIFDSFSKTKKQVLGSVLLLTQLMPLFAPNFARAAPGDRAILAEVAAGQGLNERLIKQDKNAALRMVQLLNKRHDLPNEERFAPVQALPAEGLYDLICLGREEVFTSTFLNLSALLLAKAKAEGKTIDQIATQPHTKGLLPAFIETASAYGQIEKILDSIPDKTAQRAFLSAAIESVSESFQKQAREDRSMQMAVALVDTALALRDKDLKKNFIEDFIAHYKGAKNETFRKSLGYGLSYLSESPEMADFKKDIVAAIGEDTYFISKNEGLSEKELFKDGVQYQQMLFYNDKDGRASYTHFRETFKDWKSEQKDGFIVLSRKAQGREIVIACNDPVAEDKGLANASAYLKGKDVQVIVHRGHSYHSPKSMMAVKRNQETVCLVFWGGCGGFHNVAETVTILSQRVTPPGLISTKEEGTKYVNDRLWADLCADMIQNGSVKWKPFWKKIAQRISDKRFAAYVSPEKNITAAVVSSILNQKPIRTARANALREQVIAGLR